ncbi:MAG TPA: PIG-L deacetylase family protein [Acidimicrobiales bacterium]|nr:PIG-L deacetylase family protein [Acidimicrobiales bacterium]
MAEVFLDRPARALAVFAHPDDADVSCGGTIASWADSGCKVHVAICADGDKGASDPRTDSTELVSRRRLEVDAAAKVLGITEVHRLGRRDGEFENDLALRSDLVTLIRSVRPDVMICPDPIAVFFGESYYNHRDHRILGWAALDAVAPAASSPLYFPQAGPPHAVEVVLLSGSLEPNVAIDISQTVARKSDAIACHESQFTDVGEWFRSVVHQRAEEAGRLVDVPFAESFRRITLGA